MRALLGVALVVLGVLAGEPGAAQEVGYIVDCGYPTGHAQVVSGTCWDPVNGTGEFRWRGPWPVPAGFRWFLGGPVGRIEVEISHVQIGAGERTPPVIRFLNQEPDGKWDWHAAESWVVIEEPGLYTVSVPVGTGAVEIVTSSGGSLEPHSEIGVRLIRVVEDPPPAPPGLMAVPGDTVVDLFWYPAPGAATYRVWRDGQLIADGLTQTRFHDSGLENWREYRYEVAGVTLGGTEGERAAVTAMPETPPPPPPPPPAKPTGFRATAGDGQVVLDWDVVPGVTYRLYRDGELIAEGLPGGPYLDEGLQNGRTYVYYLEAVDAAGQASSRASVTATPVAPVITEAPQVRATPMGRAVRLTWLPVPGAKGYRIWRDGQLVAELSGLEYLDQGLELETDYTYEVAAYNSNGEGPRATVTVNTGSVDTVEIGEGAKAPAMGFIQAAEAAWRKVWLVALGLIALVWILFWVIRRSRKAALGAR